MFQGSPKGRTIVYGIAAAARGQRVSGTGGQRARQFRGPGRVGLRPKEVVEILQNVMLQSLKEIACTKRLIWLGIICLCWHSTICL